MLITLYTKDSCVQCDATKRKLKALGRSYREINLEHDEVAMSFVLEMGHQQAPVVFVGFDHPTMGGEHWSGYRPDKLTAL